MAGTQPLRKILVLSAYPPKRYKDVSAGWTWDLWNGAYKGAGQVELKSPVVRYATPTKLKVDDLTGIGRMLSSGLLYMFQDDKKDTSYSFRDETSDNFVDKDIVSDLTELGMAQNIVAFYEIPEMFIEAIDNSGRYNPASEDVRGVIEIITCKRYTGNFSYTPPIPVYNNKARYGQSGSITVYSPASGSKIIKKVYDVLPEGADPSQASYSLPYTIGADPRPNGSPIFSWNYNDGGTDQRDKMNEYIKGGNWKNLDLIKVGVDGGYFEKLNLRMQKEMLGIETAVGIGAGIVGVASGYGLISEGLALQDEVATYRAGREQQFKGESMMKLGGAGIGASLGRYVMGSIKQQQQQELLNAKSVTAVAPVQIGNSDYARDIGRNWFYSCKTSYSAEDMFNFDKFLTMYGYNVGNMHIGTQHFWCRSDFVFIQINDITIVSKTAGKEMLDKVTDQLKAGVRIWRTKVNIASTNPSGNRGACPEDTP